MPAAADVSTAIVGIPLWLEALAIGAGALAGSLRAVREGLALSGVIALASALGLGGGIIRDTLLQSGTPVALTDSWLLPLVFVASIPALLLKGPANRLERLVFATDALAIGLYSVIGADKALQFDVPPVGAVVIGVLAGTGGSILADLAVGQPPVLFRPGILFGAASVIGTAMFVAGATNTDLRGVWFVAGVVVITAIRIVSAQTGWGLGPAQPITVRRPDLIQRLPWRDRDDM